MSRGRSGRSGGNQGGQQGNQQQQQQQRPTATLKLSGPVETVPAAAAGTAGDVKRMKFSVQFLQGNGKPMTGDWRVVLNDVATTSTGTLDPNGESTFAVTVPASQKLAEVKVELLGTSHAAVAVVDMSEHKEKGPRPTSFNPGYDQQGDRYLFWATVHDQNGNPMENVPVYLFDASPKRQDEAHVRTDEHGLAWFGARMLREGYVDVIMECPSMMDTEEHPARKVFELTGPRRGTPPPKPRPKTLRTNESRAGLFARSIRAGMGKR